MIKMASVVFLAVLLGACNTDNAQETDESDCAKSLCGCSVPATRPVTLRLGGEEGEPVGNARLICHDDGALLGKTDAKGVLTLQVSGSESPGCGFQPDCQVAYFRTDDDQFGRHFWFARFVLGEPVNTKAHSIELIENSD